MFYKPSTALANPYPQPTIIPKSVIKDDAADFESEVAIVIGKTCKNVTEEEALDYLLGYVSLNRTKTRTLLPS